MAFGAGAPEAPEAPVEGAGGEGREERWGTGEGSMVCAGWAADSHWKAGPGGGPGLNLGP